MNRCADVAVIVAADASSIGASDQRPHRRSVRRSGLGQRSALRRLRAPRAKLEAGAGGGHGFLALGLAPLRFAASRPIWISCRIASPRLRIRRANDQSSTALTSDGVIMVVTRSLFSSSAMTYL